MWSGRCFHVARPLAARVAAVFLAIAPDVLAQQLNRVVHIGTLGGWSEGIAVSAEGAVTGNSHKGGDVYHGFYWTLAGGMVDIGSLDTSQDYSEATAVSSGVVVGLTNAFDPAFGGVVSSAFAWTASTGTMMRLRSLPGGGWSKAWGVNAAGVVVNTSWDPLGDLKAVKWTPDGSGRYTVEPLVPVAHTNSEAYSINGNGEATGYFPMLAAGSKPSSTPRREDSCHSASARCRSSHSTACLARCA